MEIAKVILQAVQLLVVVIGLAYTGYQIRLLRLNYRDLHEWNRRKAAQDAIEGLAKLAPVTKLINEQFQFLEKNDPIALAVVQDRCQDNLELRACIHKLLNTYENLAVGVFQGVYDEGIIRAAMGWVIPTTLYQFSEYIRHRRNHGSSEAWRQVENLAVRWSEDKGRKEPERDMTGIESGVMLPGKRIMQSKPRASA